MCGWSVLTFALHANFARHFWRETTTFSAVGQWLLSCKDILHTSVLSLFLLLYSSFIELIWRNYGI